MCLGQLLLLQIPTLALVVGATDHVHPRSWKTFPTEEDMSASDLHSFYAGLEELNNSQYLTASSDGLSSFAVKDALSNLAFNTTGVPIELQGIWWLHDHPGFGQGLFSYIAGDKDLDGNAGIDKPAGNGNPGYVYASGARPGFMAFPDTPGNRSKFAWFRDHEFEESFPEFNTKAPWDSSDIITQGKLASYINVHLDVWYKFFPLPAAIIEGFTWEKFAAWEVDPKKKTDPAKCFCSVIYSRPNEIIRNNFGRYAYMIHRIADGQGTPTRYWEEFKAKLESSGIDRLVKVASPAEPVFV